MVRCHGKPIKSKSGLPVQPPAPPPPELVKPAPADSSLLEQMDRGEEPQENDYIALLLGDDDPHSSADRSIVTFLAVPTETLQVFDFKLISNEWWCISDTSWMDMGYNNEDVT